MFVLLVCGTLLDVRYRYTARMKWHLLYHVSPNVRQLVGPPRGQGHMTWVTIDEPYISNDSLTGDTESRESGPPSERLIEMAYQYKPGQMMFTRLRRVLFTCVGNFLLPVANSDLPNIMNLSLF